MEKSHQPPQYPLKRLRRALFFVAFVSFPFNLSAAIIDWDRAACINQLIPVCSYLYKIRLIWWIIYWQCTGHPLRHLRPPHPRIPQETRIWAILNTRDVARCVFRGIFADRVYCCSGSVDKCQGTYGVCVWESGLFGFGVCQTITTTINIFAMLISY